MSRTPGANINRNCGTCKHSHFSPGGAVVCTKFMKYAIVARETKCIKYADWEKKTPDKTAKRANSVQIAE